jgi:hypothetical protein
LNVSDWKAVVVDYPDHIATMISPEEKQYLYWLGRSVWQGKGLIVEIGPWLGGSTWCLAAGMQASGHRQSKRLLVYDNFIWRDFMSERASLNFKAGECFYTEFLKNISSYDGIVDSYKQALPDEIIASDQEAKSKRYSTNEKVAIFQSLPGMEPVEIVFVDGAKSWLGLKHLLLGVVDRLIPGHSLLVCQDYKYWGNYWVALMVTFLNEYFQPIHNVLSATTVTFRLVRSISRGSLEALPNHISDVPTFDALIALDHAAENLHRDGDKLGSANIQLGKVMFLSHQDKLEQAVIAFRESQKKWPYFIGNIQLERARKYLSDSGSIDITPSLSGRIKQLTLDARRAILRLEKFAVKSVKRD